MPRVNTCFDLLGPGQDKEIRRVINEEAGTALQIGVWYEFRRRVYAQPLGAVVENGSARDSLVIFRRARYLRQRFGYARVPPEYVFELLSGQRVSLILPARNFLSPCP
ncbi:MAG: hypothetical protein AAB468_00530 [Patescibacteria group bacterium]